MRFAARFLVTPRRSRIAVYEANAAAGSGTAVLAVGGFTARPVCAGAFAEILGQAADGGARVTMMDLALCGNSTYSGELTMDTWLDDMQVVARSIGDPDLVCVAASIGAWVALALNRRRGLACRSMCALAPAIDWDSQYVEPSIRAGRLHQDEVNVLQGGKPFMPKSLLRSMAKHHVLDAPFDATSPIHIIHGERDELAPLGAARQFSRQVAGASCTFDSLAGQDHGVAKLATVPSRLAFERWLGTQLA